MKKLIASAVLALAIVASASAGDLETGPKVEPTPTPDPILEPSTASVNPDPAWEIDIVELIGSTIVFILR